MSAPPANPVRKLGWIQGTALAVSLVVGSGLLGLPGLTLQAGSAQVSAAGWLLACLGAIPLIGVFSILGKAFPKAGGLAEYARAGLGEWAYSGIVAVLMGTQLVGFPALALIGGEYIQRLLGVEASWLPLLAVGMLGLAVGMNIISLRLISALNLISIVLLILLMIVVVMTNLEQARLGVDLFKSLPSHWGQLHYADLWKVSALLFWAFLGWEHLSFTLGEVRNPRHEIPLIYGLSYLFVCLLYLSLAVTSIGALIQGVDVARVSGIASLVQKSPLRGALVGGMVFCICANACSWVFGVSRLLRAAAVERILPRKLALLSPGGLPRNALVFVFFSNAGVVLLVSFFKVSVSQLIILANQNYLLMYAVSILAFFKVAPFTAKWTLGPLALLCLGFLFSGVRWEAVYPLLWLFLGWARYHADLRKAPV